MRKRSFFLSSIMAMVTLILFSQVEAGLSPLDPAGPQAASSGPIPRFAVIDLGPGFYPTAINTSGSVVGNSPTDVAEIWVNGVLNPLPESSLGYGFAAGINDSGVVVGSAPFDVPGTEGWWTAGYRTWADYACSWTSNAQGVYQPPIDLDTQIPSPMPQGYDNGSEGQAINNSGVVYGNIGTQNTLSTAFVFSSFGAPVLVFPDGIGQVVSNSDADSVSLTSSHWAGYYSSEIYDNDPQSDPNYSNDYGFLIDGLMITSDAGTVPYAGGINASGLAVGDESGNPVTISVSQIPEIQPLVGTGIPAAINDCQIVPPGSPPGTQPSPTPQIVGTDASGNGSLWDYTNLDGSYSATTVQKNINQLIPANSGWSIVGTSSNYSAALTAINDSGAIVGTATYTPTGATDPIAAGSHGVLLAPLTLDQVTFSGTGWYGVCDDSTGLEFYSEHDSNQWQEPNPSGTTTLAQTGWQDPVCYSSGSTMTAAVQFKVPAGSSAMWSGFTNMKIKGVGVSDSGHPDDSTGYNFPSTSATYSSTNNAIVATGMTCSLAFPSSTVGYIKPLTIQWYFSIDGGTTWSLVNQSKNELFITLNSPTLDPTSDGNYKLFQTVLYYACSDAGATGNDTAVAHTWSLFTSSGTGPANIKAWNPTDKSYDRKLYYYGASRGFGGAQPVSTTALLAATDGDGECYSFGELFQDALWANGISNNGIRITPTVSGLSFLVKDLTPSATGSLPGYAPFSWKMAFSASAGEMQPPPSTATTYGTYGDFVNLSTHKGQNTAPPLEKVFGNHYIVQYGSGYYDPSYGATYTGENNFEDQSVQDYCAGISGDAVDLALRPSSGLHIIQFQTLNTPHE